MTPKTPDYEQPALIEISAPPGADKMGTRHQEAFEIAYRAAVEQEIISPLDMGLVSIARANAWSLDAAESMGQKGAYAISNVTTPYREALTALRMVPDLESDKEIDEQLVAALKELSAPGTSQVGSTSTDAG